MVRNFILIFCLCVCFCQYHISVSLYTHLYTDIINKLLHGWFVCTIFIIHSLWRIAKLTRSLRSLVRLTILHNSWIKIVRTHQPWSNLYIYQESKKRKYKANFIRKYMKYFINFLKKNVKFNSLYTPMAHVILFVIHRWIMHYLPRALMRGRQSNFSNLTWYALHQWNT